MAITVTKIIKDENAVHDKPSFHSSKNGTIKRETINTTVDIASSSAKINCFIYQIRFFNANIIAPSTQA